VTPVQPSLSGAPAAGLPFPTASLGTLSGPQRVASYSSDAWRPSVSQRELLYREMQPLLCRLIVRYGSDPELRQELPGEFYCRFHALYEGFDPRRGIPIRPYLVRCLTTGIYTWARSHWRRKRHEVCLPPLAEPAAEPSADPASAMQTAAQRELVLRQLRDAIGRLSPRQREVLIARYYGARSFEEISQSMGICPATVRSLLRHAVHNLRRQMEGSRGD
jgi:RNA polymerase sigma factor (sigma-70 family)